MLPHPPPSSTTPAACSSLPCLHDPEVSAPVLPADRLERRKSSFTRKSAMRPDLCLHTNTVSDASIGLSGLFAIHPHWCFIASHFTSTISSMVTDASPYEGPYSSARLTLRSQQKFAIRCCHRAQHQDWFIISLPAYRLVKLAVLRDSSGRGATRDRGFCFSRHIIR